MRFSAAVYSAPYAPLAAVGSGSLVVPSGVSLASRGLGPRATLLWPNETAELLVGAAGAGAGTIVAVRYQVPASAPLGAAPILVGSVSVGVPSDPTATILALAGSTSGCGGAAPGVAACLAVLSSLPQPSASGCLLQLHIAAADDGRALVPPTCVAAASAGVTALAAPPAVATIGDATSLSVVLTFSSAGVIYGATACVVGGAIVVNPNGPCASAADAAADAAAPPPPLPFHVGEHVAVALALDSGGDVLVFEAHDRGYCPSTETRNKQPFPKLCDQRPHASGGAYLNWQWARLPAFTAMLLSGRGASPCSDAVLHGCFGMGSMPAVALAPASGLPTLAVLHTGTSASEKDPDGAGPPLPFAGLVLDGWPLPDLP